MITCDDFDPLFGTEREEIPLPNAPIVRVLAQVRFSEIVSIAKKTFIAEFQEEIRKAYPKLQSEEYQIVIAGGAEPEVRSEKIWRFYDAENVWRISLALNFVVLETTIYTSRADFMARFRDVLEALARTIAPTHVTRIGVRYIDQIRMPELEHIDQLLRPEMLGVVTSELRSRLRHTVSEALCDVAEGELIVRWGFLPENGTHDPSVMMPTKGTSWFLDLDVYQSHTKQPIAYDSDRLHEVGLILATRAYAFFRWAITSKFMSIYGGRP